MRKFSLSYDLVSIRYSNIALKLSFFRLCYEISQTEAKENWVLIDDHNTNLPAFAFGLWLIANTCKQESNEVITKL